MRGWLISLGRRSSGGESCHSCAQWRWAWYLASPPSPTSWGGRDHTRSRRPDCSTVLTLCQTQPTNSVSGHPQCVCVSMYVWSPSMCVRVHVCLVTLNVCACPCTSGHPQCVCVSMYVWSPSMCVRVHVRLVTVNVCVCPCTSGHPQCVCVSMYVWSPSMCVCVHVCLVTLNVCACPCTSGHPQCVCVSMYVWSPSMCVRVHVRLVHRNWLPTV